MASAMTTTPGTEGARVDEFKAGFKDPKTQFQAANAGSAFAAEMEKARGEKQRFTDQLAAYSGMDEGYKDQQLANQILSGEIGANVAGGAPLNKLLWVLIPLWHNKHLTMLWHNFKTLTQGLKNKCTTNITHCVITLILAV